jgi:predicted metalloprotease with PDZ domain
MQRSFTLAAASLSMSLFASGLLGGSALAQDPQVRVRTMEAPRALAYTLAAPNRAIIGVGLETGGVGDTLGLEIIEVTDDGPAARAGITTGARLQEINGVSLRISAADARDPLTSDAGYRRLQRELGKVEPGDTVSLRVLKDGQTRTVQVVTTSASAMRGNRVFTGLAGTRERLEKRAALGMSLSSAGNARDTLGVFITSVRTGGPAEKAGIIEGERIAAINGVDVRVPREDVTDPTAGSARVSRFMRELDKVEPGASVQLRVFTNGRYRDVTVVAGNASEFGTSGFRFETGTPGVFFREPMGELMRDGMVRLRSESPMRVFIDGPDGLQLRAPSPPRAPRSAPDAPAVLRRFEAAPVVPAVPPAPAAPVSPLRATRVMRAAM